MNNIWYVPYSIMQIIPSCTNVIHILFIKSTIMTSLLGLTG